MPEIKVIHGDCLKIMVELEQEFDLVFADPPFNLRQDYKGFEDSWPDEREYNKFVYQFVFLCDHLCEGVLALHGNDYLCEQYLRIADLDGLQRIGWINWFYDFGQCTRSNWIDARCHCLFFTDKEKYTWNPEEVLIESARVRYGDSRVNDTENGGKRLPGTIWGIGERFWGRVQGNNQERREGHPNQLPELYLARIIKAYTNPGDWVLDPFGGSGTTAVVAQALGRNCITIDISEENCASIKERLVKGAVRVSIPKT